MRKKKFNVMFRRKRQGKTNYKKRLKLLLSGKPRLVVRIFLKNISAQIIEYSPQGDRVVVSANIKDLKESGWKFNMCNVPAAYLMGLLIGKKAQEKGVKQVILDTGLKNPSKGGKIFACLMGAVDAGLDIPHSKEEFPSKEKVSGKDIQDYANKLKENKAGYEKQFSKYIKEGLDPLTVSKSFEEVKNKLKVD